MSGQIYLDNSMTSKPSEKAVAAMLLFFTERWGVPAAPHQKGNELISDIESSLKSIYKLFGAKEEDTFIFTSSGAEAINHVIWSAYLDVTRTTGKNHFVTSNIEEAPTLMSISRLQQLGCMSRLVNPNKDGVVTAESIAEALSPRTALVSLSWANGLTGVVQPINDVAKLCQERGVLLHVDATHGIGKLHYDLAETAADFITFSGDQMHAPKGTGGLFVKAGRTCSPFIAGGLEQGGKRAGPINVPGLVALGQAAVEAIESRDYMCTEIARLRDKLETGIGEIYPEATLFFKESERLPNCTAIGFPKIVNEALLFLLNRKNVFASIGGGSFQQIGLLLEASGVTSSLAQTAIGFSLSRYTNEEEIDRAVAAIGQAVGHLRKTSNYLEIK